MKKTTITISFDEDKLSALKIYLAEKELRVEEVLVKALDGLYAKAVPQPVQRFLELRSGGAADPAPAKAKPKPAEKEEKPDGRPGDRPVAE